MSNVRYLNLTREKKISGSIVPYEINIDGQWVAELNNGETINIPLDYSKHKFYMRAEFPGSISLSEGLVIPEGVFDHSLYCRHKAGLTKVKLWWEIDEHQETLNNQIRQEQMHNTAIIKEINTILASIEDGKMIGCRDYSILNQLSEDAKKSPMYIKWLESTKKECFSMALKQYMDGKWGYERLFMPIRDLCTIPELKDSCKKYLKHFDYYMMSKNAVNSVLNEDNPVEEIIELSKGSRKINDHISDELSKALSCVSDYYKNGEIEKAIDSLLLVNVDEKDLWGIKRLLILSAMTEGATDRESEKYMVVKQLYKTVYLLLDATKSEKTYINTVDEIIAETIRCSYTKVYTKIDDMLDEFLGYTCKMLEISGSQYNILQKVFAYFEAYEQEKRILENMVSNCITRSSEQEERLTFLQKGSYNKYNFEDNTSQESDYIEDGNLKYEYRSVNWDSKKIEEYFENLSLQNRAVEFPFVVREWNKEVSINTNNFNITAIGKLISDKFIENYGERFTTRLGTSKTMDNYSESMDTISIMADSDKEARDGYSWIEYFVTAEKINNKQVAFAIYTLYFPGFDREVICAKSVIEKNKICVQKINLLKEKQNPRINRMIQNVNNLIIEVLENWANDENKKVDIYS